MVAISPASAASSSIWASAWASSAIRSQREAGDRRVTARNRSECSRRRCSVRHRPLVLGSDPLTFEEMERAFRQRLEALPPAARAELVHVLRLPDIDRVDAIGSYWGNPKTRTFAELLIDCEEAGRYGGARPDAGGRALDAGLVGRA